MGTNGIFNFCAGFKVDRKFKVTWNNQIQQQLNRFYVSNKGAYLYKTKPTSKNPENMLDGFAVQLFNKYEEKEMKNYNINYQYYIMKAEKIIYDLTPKQDLFSI